jgi:hypothetical protein
MPIKVKANGKTFTFPDGTSQQDIGGAVDDYFKGNAKKQDSSPSFLSEVANVAVDIMPSIGAQFSPSDIASGAGHAFGQAGTAVKQLWNKMIGDQESANAATEQQKIENSAYEAQNHSNWAQLGEIGAQALMAIPAVAAGVAILPEAAGAAATAGAASLGGAITSALTSPSDSTNDGFWKEKLGQAAFGAALNVAGEMIPGIPNAIRKSIGKKVAAGTPAEMKQIAKDLSSKGFHISGGDIIHGGRNPNIKKMIVGGEGSNWNSYHNSSKLQQHLINDMGVEGNVLDHETMKMAGDRLNSMYDELRAPGKTIVLDNTFSKNLIDILNKLGEGSEINKSSILRRVADTLDKNISNKRVLPQRISAEDARALLAGKRINPNRVESSVHISADQYANNLSDIRQEIQRLGRAGKKSESLQLSKILDDMIDSAERHMTPEEANKWKTANNQWSVYATLRDLASEGKLSSTGDLNMAAFANHVRDTHPYKWVHTSPKLGEGEKASENLVSASKAIHTFPNAFNVKGSKDLEELKMASVDILRHSNAGQLKSLLESASSISRPFVRGKEMQKALKGEKIDESTARAIKTGLKTIGSIGLQEENK